MTSKRKQFRPTETTSIFWCRQCNLPLIDPDCAICNSRGHQLRLGPPGDVRFGSPYERRLLHDILMGQFGADPLGQRIILLNKIGGRDKTDQVIVDGLVLGVLYYDLEDWQLDLTQDGAAIMAQHTPRRRVELSDGGGHLSGKTVTSEVILSCSGDVRQGDQVIIRKDAMVGVGTALQDAPMDRPEPALKIRKLGRAPAGLGDAIPSMARVIQANIPAIRRLGKNAINTIRGMANQQEFRDAAVYVSFSGGKDSLVVLDLTRSALKKNPRAYFINTGLEFPETLEYVERFCRDNAIPLEIQDAGNAFWEHLPRFGPPAKDYRWCCKVCKLAPAGLVPGGRKYLTVDGKRRYESFSRARIAPKEENPFVPGQVNIYPIRDWRALEVWLYIRWRGLEYNPLYDQGFERIGCWLCPAALAAEYKRMLELHPQLYRKWEDYLHRWAAERGLSDEYIDLGFWRWREHPPKMRLLAQQLGMELVPRDMGEEAFQIQGVSGISPCTAGGYSIEGSVRGIGPGDARDMMRMLGRLRHSPELGVLVAQGRKGSVKFYSDGTLQVNAGDKRSTKALFEAAARLLMRAVKCTGCRICEQTCPKHALDFVDGHIRVSQQCDGCGKCDEVCVVTRYAGRITDV